MAELKIGPLRKPDAPSFTGTDYGPDFTQTPEKEPREVPKVNQKNPPKSSVFTKLGQNKKARSPVRKLTREAPTDNELSDLERLEGWYRAIATAARPFHAKFSTAMYEQANECAVAWFGLAENNDTVRRWILGLIEGGDWGKVVAAHTPIFIAVVPERVLEKFFLKGMGLFANHMINSELDDVMDQFGQGMNAASQFYGNHQQ